MKPLLVLLVTFAIATFVLKFSSREYDLALSARIALSAMLLFTAVAHFVFTKGMVLMMPPFIPCKKGFVYFTGMIEILAAFGLLISSLRVLTGWLLILFFYPAVAGKYPCSLPACGLSKGQF